MLPDCLKSLSWVDEIVVVDSGSSDKTVNIAKRNGAKVFLNKSFSFSSSRNLGLKHAKGEWVLYIDADERVTEELRGEIVLVIGGTINNYNAYAIPRRNIILGKEFKFGGQRPDYVKRLFLKVNLENWDGELHEEPRFKGELGHLKNSLLHIKHESFPEMVEKTNNWSEVEAKLMFLAKHPPMTIPRFFSAILREFWLRMIRQLAFLDGAEGIMYAMYLVFSRFISYAKLWELQYKKGIVK